MYGYKLTEIVLVSKAQLKFQVFSFFLPVGNLGFEWGYVISLENSKCTALPFEMQIPRQLTVCFDSPFRNVLPLEFAGHILRLKVSHF